MNKVTCMTPVFLLAMFFVFPVKDAFAIAGSLVLEIRQVNPDGAVLKTACDRSASNCEMPFVINEGTVKKQPMTIRVDNYMGIRMMLWFKVAGKNLLISNTDDEKKLFTFYPIPLTGFEQKVYKVTLYDSNKLPVSNLEITASIAGMDAEKAFAESSKSTPYQEGNELYIRQSIAEQFRDLFTQKKFDELNKLAERYRESDERTPSGVWKLTAFYSGLKLLHGKKDDEKRRAALFAITQEWIDKNPSPAAYIVKAKLYYHQAWDIRGDGYADTVGQKQWEGFHAYLQKAREVLEARKAEASVDPEWYVSMIDLSREQQAPAAELQTLYTEAITKFPYYYNIYFAVVRFLQPKWGGSYKLVEEFAESAIAYTKGKEGSGIYARIYWHVTGEEDSISNPFEKAQIDWGKMKEGMRDVLARYPDQWNINNFAYFACVAKDKDETKSLMSRITMPIPEAWYNKLSLYKKCMDGLL